VKELFFADKTAQSNSRLGSLIILSGTVYTKRQKSAELVQWCMECVNSVLGDVNLWNNLNFSLYAVLFVYHIVVTLDD